MFENLGWAEIIALLLIALFIFGPDRLPKVINDTMRFIRNIRAMARNATTDLSRELGTDIDLEDLNPKTFLRKHVLSEEDEQALRKPLKELYSDIEDVAKETDLSGRSTASDTAQGNGHKKVKFDVDAT